MFILGCHLSVTGGYLSMGKTATSIGGNTFQFFPRNPRGSQSAPVKEADALALKAWMQEHDSPILLPWGLHDERLLDEGVGA